MDSKSSGPVVGNVLYPSDFSGGSEGIFAHALKIALMEQSTLTLIHVSAEDREDWNQFLGVREMLIQWGLLPENSPRSAVPDLGIDVRKVMAHGVHPVHAVLKYEEKHPADLIVMAAHPNEGAASFFRESEEESLARESGAMTLFVPAGRKGFVSTSDGSASLRNILIPIAASPDPQPAVNAAAWIVRGLGCPSGTFTLLYVGKAESVPVIQGPEVAGWSWSEVAKEGEVIEVILRTASGIGADLIVMSSDGRDSFWDTFRGSHSERVLRAAACPLLTVPVKKESQEG